MFELNQAAGVVALMALVIYFHRIAGYLLGLKVQHIGWLRPVLELLPGCAIMAILVPAAIQGTAMDFIALGLVVGIMWFSGSVALASAVGLGVLFFAPGFAAAL